MEILILILVGPVLGYIVAYSWPLGRFMEQKEKLKKLRKRKTKSIGDLGWEAYLADVNNCSE